MQYIYKNVLNIKANSLASVANIYVASYVLPGKKYTICFKHATIIDGVFFVFLSSFLSFFLSFFLSLRLTISGFPVAYRSDALRKHAYSKILKILPPKNENFNIKKYVIFHISAQNIDYGYSLELPRWGSSNEYPQSMFWAEIRKIMHSPVNPSFTNKSGV